ncbi:MAG: hypothetical protein DWP92_01150 [Armatimonadetes bacterium]|nr:MAG: hypothetical protein DWP92_01150 [Armatimonadota bacterium]
MPTASSASGAYVDQVADARIVGSSTCGCPTIHISVDGSKTPRFRPSEIIVDAEGTVSERNWVGVILHVRDGLPKLRSTRGMASMSGGYREGENLSIVKQHIGQPARAQA